MYSPIQNDAEGAVSRLQGGERVPRVRIGPLGLVYLVIGIIVAALNDYFDNVGSARRIGEALLAVLLWPLVLFGVDINLR